MRCLPFEKAKKEAGKITKVCVAYNQNDVCDHREKLRKIFGSNEKRTDVLIDYTLFICACQILDINCENVPTESWELIKEEMSCCKTDIRIFNKEELEILTKPHFQVSCEACWLEVRAISSVFSPLLNNRVHRKVNSVMNFIINIIKKLRNFLRD